MKALHVFQKEFNPGFEKYITQKINDTLLHYTNTAVIHDIAAHIQKLASGGKRLRPYIAWLTYTSVHGNDKEMVRPMLYALELFQLFALVHDDIIDDAPERRGVACIHTVFNKAQAILVGDLLFAWAMEAAFASMHSDAVRLFHMLTEDTVIGQMLDVALTGKLATDEQSLDTRLELKTTRYTFIYPMLIGLALADDIDYRVHFYKLGKLLGTLFQYLDDLSDILGDEKELGKKTSVDIKNGVPTHITHFIMNTSPANRKKLEKIFGRAKSSSDYETIQKLCIETGVLEFFSKKVRTACIEASGILKTIPLSQKRERDWRECIRYFQDYINRLSEIHA